MDWQDDGIVLSARRHGEGAAIVSLLTLAHGRHAGLVRGGAGRRARGVYQPGNKVTAEWRARLEDHLGTYRCELVAADAAAVLGDPLALAGLSAACAVAEAALPEREPHPALYRDFAALVPEIAARASADAHGRNGLPPWTADYVRWELAVLRDTGFGLDLSACAATGARDRLIYVSPKSGSAVSEEAGAAYRDKLLPLPDFLLADRGADLAVPPAAVADGLALTGYFLERHVFAVHNRGKVPAARTRFVDRVRQFPTISGSSNGPAPAGRDSLRTA